MESGQGRGRCGVRGKLSGGARRPKILSEGYMGWFVG